MDLVHLRNFLLFPLFDGLQFGSEAEVSQPQLHVLIDKEVA